MCCTCGVEALDKYQDCSSAYKVKCGDEFVGQAETAMTDAVVAVATHKIMKATHECVDPVSRREALLPVQQELRAGKVQPSALFPVVRGFYSRGLAMED